MGRCGQAVRRKLGRLQWRRLLLLLLQELLLLLRRRLLLLLLRLRLLRGQPFHHSCQGRGALFLRHHSSPTAGQGRR